MKHPKGWYKDLVIYQIYPRSFKDSNGDGIGDLKGITEKLDYLAALGINAIWLSPVYASPGVDNGYDISDYKAIASEFGNMEDWETFRDGAHARGIAVIMDLVLNHTSDQHEWFIQSRKSKNNPFSNFYIWRDPASDGGAPNQWQSVFGGSAWEYVPERNQYYLHFFAKEQPDLNWEDQEAREKIFETILFWNQKGVDGYRVDAISYLDKGLDGRARPHERFGTAACANLPGTHLLLQEMIQKTIAPDHLMTVGEVNVHSVQDLLDYTAASRGEFDMAIPFIPPIVEIKTWSPEKIKRELSETYAATYKECWWARFFSNHDKPRQVSLYGNDRLYRKQSAKMLAAFLHTIPGTPFIYQGEELGMTNAVFPSIEMYDDIDTKNFYQEMLQEGKTEKEALSLAQQISRDNARTPFQWENTVNAGFSAGKPWLPVNPNYPEINAASQINDPDSVFSFYKKLISLRKENRILIDGDFTMLSPEEGKIIAYSRSLNEETWIAVHNFSEEENIFSHPALAGEKELLLFNYPDAQPDDSDMLSLRPYETMVFRSRR